VITLIDCGVSRGVNTMRVAVAIVPDAYEPLPSVTSPSALLMTLTESNCCTAVSVLSLADASTAAVWADTVASGQAVSVTQTLDKTAFQSGDG